MPAESAEFAQPFPALIVDLADENVSAVKVGMEPVCVYEGNKVTAPALLMTVGGHAKLEDTLAGICPAPEPPVCEGLRGGCQGAVFPQVPSATRGSLGIHPFCRPNW